MNFSSFFSRSKDPNTNHTVGSCSSENTGGDGKDGDNVSLTFITKENTIMCLKRQLCEERARSSVLEQSQKDLISEQGKFEDALITERMAFEAERNKNEYLQKGMEELQRKYENMKLVLSKVQKECVSVKKDRTRMNELVGSLREDVVNAHHATVGARLKTRHAEERCKELEDRMIRERSGGAYVMDRIKELQAVQEEIRETVVVRRRGGGDRRTTRRVLASLGEERVELVSRIANLVTRGRTGSLEREVDDIGYEEWNRRREGDLAVERSGTEDEVESIHNGDGNVRNARMMDEEEDLERDDDGRYEDADGRSEVLTPLNRLRSLGSGMERRRQTRRAMMQHAETVHRLVRKDIRVLSAIVEEKSGEVEKLEDLLQESRKKVYLLEEEQQKRRIEKRVVNSEDWMIRNGIGCSIRSSGSQGSGVVAERGTIFEWGHNSGNLFIDGSCSAFCLSTRGF